MSQTTPPSGSKTVLVVDNDPAIVNLVTRTLATVGYQVLSATSGSEALAISRRHPDPIDLVVIEVAMPDMSGFVLGELLETFRPSTVTLYITGDPGVIDSLRQRGFTQHPSFLLKPLTRTAILDRVRQILATDQRLPRRVEARDCQP